MNDWDNDNVDNQYLGFEAFKSGDLIDLDKDGQVKIIKELGCGGRTIVYLCEYNQKQYALKWFTQELPEVFYQNLKSNHQNGVPNASKSFLWPLMLTKKQNNTFGYVMDLRDPEYREFGDYLLGRAKYQSVSAIVNAAINLTKGFQDLSKDNYVYADINDGCLYIHPVTGGVIFADTEIIHKNNINLGMMGKIRYMAPEILLGSRPDHFSNHFSLSVVLFLFFFNSHPLEGQKTLVPCMTENHEKKFFATEALFIFDENDHSNQPVEGIHTNVIKRWPHYPSLLRNIFIQAFSQEAIKNPSQRVTPEQWLQILVEVRNRLVEDDNGNERFLADDEKPKVALKSIEGLIALAAEKIVYVGHSTLPFARVFRDNYEPDAWVLKNISNHSWKVETVSGKIKDVPPNELMPVKAGLKISCAVIGEFEVLALNELV